MLVLDDLEPGVVEMFLSMRPDTARRSRPTTFAGILGGWDGPSVSRR
jgi:hypothetical protein